MTDDMKKDQGQNPGQSGPGNRNRNRMILQRRILRKTPISRMTNRSNRTRAASVALPNGLIWVPAWRAGPLLHANFIEIQLSQRAKLSHRTITSC